MSKSTLAKLGMNDKIAFATYDEIMEWLDENVQHQWRANNRHGGIWFSHPEDAVMFKLRWAGVFD